MENGKGQGDIKLMEMQTRGQNHVKTAASTKSSRPPTDRSVEKLNSESRKTPTNLEHTHTPTDRSVEKLNSGLRR